MIEYVPIYEGYWRKGLPGSGLRLCEVQSNLCQIFLNRNRITKRHQVVTLLPHKRPEFLAFASRQGMNLSYDHLRIVQRVFGHSGEHGIHLADNIVVVLDLGMRGWCLSSGGKCWSSYRTSYTLIDSAPP